MQDILVPEAIRRIADSNDRRLAWLFFVIFSRFEYALKRHPEYLMPGVGNAEANWDRFGADNHACFDASTALSLRSAVEYFVAHPPRKQIRTNGVMSWSEPQAWDGRGPKLVWLLLMVRLVRNNLFHGGKFPLVPILDPSRDRDLLLHAITILNAALTLNSEVARAFSEDFDSEPGTPLPL